MRSLADVVGSVAAGALAGANGLAQIAIITGWRLAIENRTVLTWAFLTDLLLCWLCRDRVTACSVVFHWAVIGLIVNRKRAGFSYIDAAYIVWGTLINWAIARLLINWILTTR